MVMDARTGEVLHSRNADTRLHPASLTKMMTLYVVFEAVRNGEITMDTKIRVSRKAAAEPPSKLGLKSGSRIALRYLVRASAVKSANDAATAMAEAISGSEAAFARRMTRTAKAMGMTRTTFKNAHGLTESGHMSTARDMTILGRHMLYDYPQYYNLFSRRSTSAGITTVNNTNRRLLNAYRGADGIKTGYTRAAGFNLVASAERGNERILATMFGGSSSASRNARVAELLDMGFARAPSRAPLRKPKRPAYTGNVSLGSTLRLSGAITKSPIPPLRPGAPTQSQGVLVALADPTAAPLVPLTPANTTTTAEDIATAIEAVDLSTSDPKLAEAAASPEEEVEKVDLVAAVMPAKVAPGGMLIRPRLRPRLETATAQLGLNAEIAPKPAPQAVTAAATPTKAVAIPASVQATGAVTLSLRPQPAPEPVVVTRLANTGSTDWSVTVGRYSNQFEAEKALLRVALKETATLNGAVRKVVNGPQGWEARFLGLTRDNAQLACRKLSAQSYDCAARGPS
ncbi:MAG: serine hydrolase [Rhodobacteraceae bacterium]|nr:serine hydrolase [Paracoccaceae bacterium]